MKRLARLLRQTEFALLLFLLCLVLFNWHFIGLPGEARGCATYVYLFLAWAAVILILFLMDGGKELPEVDTREREDKGV